MLHTNQACHMSINRVTREWVTSRVTRDSVTSHVTREWVTSHVNPSCHTWMSHVTCESIMSHVFQSRHTSHVNQSCHSSMIHITCDTVWKNDSTRSLMWMGNVVYEWGMSHVNERDLGRSIRALQHTAKHCKTLQHTATNERDSSRSIHAHTHMYECVYAYAHTGRLFHFGQRHEALHFPGREQQPLRKKQGRHCCQGSVCFYFNFFYKNPFPWCQQSF